MMFVMALWVLTIPSIASILSLLLTVSSGPQGRDSQPAKPVKLTVTVVHLQVNYVMKLFNQRITNTVRLFMLALTLQRQPTGTD